MLHRSLPLQQGVGAGKYGARTANEGAKTQGALHSTKTFKNLERVANDTEYSWKSFQKFWKLLNFQNANQSTDNPWSKNEWKENFQEKNLENLGIPREVCPLDWKFWKMLFHLLLEVDENSKRTFWLNVKSP